MERTFAKQLSSLDLIFDFLKEFSVSVTHDATLRQTIMVAVEEIFTNFVKYNVDSRHPVLISLEQVSQEVVVRMIDHNVAPWDITRYTSHRHSGPIESRRAGGMGLQLVRQLVDSLEYQHIDGNSIVTMRKRIGAEHV